MTIHVEAKRCPQNHRCPILRICPHGAISQEGYSAPKIDMIKCTSCGRCIRMCAFGAFRAVKNPEPTLSA